jgi:hypothetical protein
MEQAVERSDAVGDTEDVPREADVGVESPAGPPRCLAIAEKGIRTGSDYAAFMSTLMTDLVLGQISPQAGNAAVNAGGKLLKVVEMQYRFGQPTDGIGKKDVLLAEPYLDLGE